MITVNIREEDEFIKLGQALKKAGVVGSGVDAKMVILDGQVSDVLKFTGRSVFPVSCHSCDREA